jgi:hypothetical protein
MSKLIQLILVILLGTISANSQGNCNVVICDTFYSNKAYIAIYSDTMSDYKNTKYRHISFFVEDTTVLTKQYVTNQLIENNHLYITSSSYFSILLVNQCSDILNYYTSAGYSDSIMIEKEYTKGLITVYSIYSPKGFVKLKLGKEVYNLSSSINQNSYKGEKEFLDAITPVVGLKREEDE